MSPLKPMILNSVVVVSALGSDLASGQFFKSSAERIQTATAAKLRTKKRRSAEQLAKKSRSINRKK